jgi:hypothetical protein
LSYAKKEERRIVCRGCSEDTGRHSFFAQKLKEDLAFVEERDRAKVNHPASEKKNVVEKSSAQKPPKRVLDDEEEEKLLAAVERHEGDRLGAIYQAYRTQGGKKQYKTVQRTVKLLSEKGVLKVEKHRGGPGGSCTFVWSVKKKKRVGAGTRRKRTRSSRTKRATKKAARPGRKEESKTQHRERRGADETMAGRNQRKPGRGRRARL